MNLAALDKLGLIALVIYVLSYFVMIPGFLVVASKIVLALVFAVYLYLLILSVIRGRPMP